MPVELPADWCLCATGVRCHFHAWDRLPCAGCAFAVLVDVDRPPLIVLCARCQGVRA